MLEWFATIATAELGKVIFEQVLKLGQAAAEDYVKDFFKGCLKDGVVAAKPEAAKKAIAEALQAFLLLVEDELLDQGISELAIRDRYEQPLLQFVQDDTVKPILGKAFEQDCRAIDIETLSATWQKSLFRQQPFPPMPADFDWQRIGSEYVKKVRRIVRESPELRSLLDTELLENIARNTAQLSPGFDIETYRHTLQTNYGYLRLFTLDSTDRADAIKLWAMFIEQTVREALPPLRYDLPRDVQKSDFLEKSDFWTQPARKVFEVIGQGRSSLALLNKEGTESESPPFQEGFRGIESYAQRAVILGDPGSGKSSLLQYLALEWVEVKTEKLPLLIELREFAINPSANFLEFLHRGRGVDWQFDQQQLHQHLLENPTRVMFDGLDEVFDRATQATVIDDIIRFSQQYPKAQILVTSRSIGYNPDRLQHSGFRHFTIQSLNTDEMHEFIDRWYDLSMGSDPDKVRLKQRLKDAIANSKAIANLADNPLLLTMMAILNRRQELPRDRADLYDQASRVLLYHWDVDHKQLQIPMDAIGRREKKEMLRAIAYEMQAGEEGLKGNLISSDRLTRILTDYLRDQGFSEPREKANRLIQQLRERNFILCYRGADTYGFMHRTFLEYFCAVEIVHRFEKQRTLTFEQLRDEVFGNHWQDETWHEVLRLICGAIDPRFAGELIEFLIKQEPEYIDEDFGCPEGDEEYEGYQASHSLKKLLIATDCFGEIGKSEITELIGSRLLSMLKEFYKDHSSSLLAAKFSTKNNHNLLENLHDILYAICNRISKYFQDRSDTLLWLKEQWEMIDNSEWWEIIPLVSAVSRHFSDDPQTLPWLLNDVFGKDEVISSFVLEMIGRYLKNQPQALSSLQSLVRNGVSDAVFTIAEYYAGDPKSLEQLMNYAQQDEDSDVQISALVAIVRYYGKNSTALTWVQQFILDRLEQFPQRQVVEEIIEHYGDKTDTLIWLQHHFLPQAQESKWFILNEFLNYHPSHPKTLELLRDRALNDPDEQLRQWAQEQLQQMESQGGASGWT
ncbi:MAG: NACHT domain-containing protein [Leptolyngbyaceae cyanobacterium bins.349]|nr:NACHT domain-containing protein [Leptolyngbyaceae cyanobacterium bins.349]